MSRPPYTADQLEAGVANALKAHDVPAAIDILRVLVSVDATRAAAVYETIEVGLDLAEILNEFDPDGEKP